MNLRYGRTIFTVTSLLLIMSLTVVAQQYANLEVSNPQFVYDVNSNFNLRTANSTTSKLAPVTMGVYQEVSALFRNTGSKSIKSTLWEFIFYEDAMRTKVERVYTSRSKTIISPGEMIRLKKVGRLSDHTQYQEAKVVRIEYEDGTIWEGVKTKY